MRKALTLATIAVTIGIIVAPVVLVASDDDPPDPWYPPMIDTTGTYKTIYVNGVPYQAIECPAPGGLRCTLFRQDPVPYWDPDDIGWFLTDDDYYYFYADDEDGVITNAVGGTIIMIVPRLFLDE